MEPAPNVSLSNYSTMRLGGIADYLQDVHTGDDVAAAYRWATEHGLPVIMIGGGSNVYWSDDGFRGLVLVNKIMGYEDHAEPGDTHLLRIGAGEPWDSVVARTVQSGLTGIEALSLIPGTAGGTPVQNVGAYGQQISDVLIEVAAFDTHEQQFVHIPAADCALGYRTSRFKSTDRGRYLITSITLRLRAGNPLPPYYTAVQAYLERYPEDTPITPAVLREAVIAIRRAKLPDPADAANNGSFFANPIISQTEAAKLLQRHPDMPCWPDGDGSCKVPAAWLIEQAGMKGFHDAETGMATWKDQPLVLVNEHAHTTHDLIRFKQKIIDAVHARFDITLQQEPEMLPYTSSR